MNNTKLKNRKISKIITSEGLGVKILWINLLPEEYFFQLYYYFY